MALRVDVAVLVGTGVGVAESVGVAAGSVAAITVCVAFGSTVGTEVLVETAVAEAVDDGAVTRATSCCGVELHDAMRKQSKAKTNASRLMFVTPSKMITPPEW